MTEYVTRTRPHPGEARAGGRGIPSQADGGTGAFDGHEAAAILEETRGTVDPALQAALDSLPGSMRRISRYHFGWEHADGTPAAGNAGKAIRPALVLAAAAALGGPAAAAAALPAAAAPEPPSLVSPNLARSAHGSPVRSPP